VRRFGLFVLLGYALHFPAARFADLVSVSEAKWRSFLAVDVLQLIGVSFIGVQLLVLVARSRRAFTIAVFVLAAAVIAATPAAWETDWTALLPLALAAYMGPAIGSLFPLFPWLAFVLLGVGFGQVYSRWGAAHLGQYANLALLLPGGGLLLGGLTLYLWPPPAFGTGGGSLIPMEVLLRVGTCLVLLAGVAHLSRWIDRLPHVFGAVAQESLLIYFVHLCIVYGSVWNRGLAQIYGATLTPARTLLFIVLVLGSMVALAWYWNWAKHTRPGAARWMSYAVGSILIYRLL
jgi:uncharacterized membrane protein